MDYGYDLQYYGVGNSYSFMVTASDGLEQSWAYVTVNMIAPVVAPEADAETDNTETNTPDTDDGISPGGAPAGGHVDPITAHVYDADGNLFGKVGDNGAVYWPSDWPPPAPIETPLDPFVTAGPMQPVALVLSNYRKNLQSRVGRGDYAILSKLPQSAHSASSSCFTQVPNGAIVGASGAKPCILMLVVGADAVWAYHFNTSHDAYTTLLRDSAAFPAGAHVLLGAGDAADNQSMITLHSVNKFLMFERPDLVVDGLVNSCAIFVNNLGQYFTNQSAINLYYRD